MKLTYSTDEAEDPVGFWELKRGGETLAMLERLCLDSGWVHCFFFPEPEFELYRQFFTHSGAVQREREEEMRQTIAREGIYLETHDGQKVSAFTLVVEGSDARLRLAEVNH